MAWEATPSSGSGPYVISGDFTNKDSLNGIHYEIVIRYSTEVGSCPDPLGVNRETFVADIMRDGQITRTDPVLSGSCAAYKIEIIDLSDNSIIETQTTAINNV